MPGRNRDTGRSLLVAHGAGDKCGFRQTAKKAKDPFTTSKKWPGLRQIKTHKKRKILRPFLD
jgi:hypothetical protein